MGGQDQFCVARSALRQAPEPEQINQVNGPNRSVNDLNKYFDALATVATTENTVLEELVRANEDLTTTNAKLLASVARIIEAN